MKLYRFLTRAYFGGRIVEAGEEVMASDDTVPSAHMVDVAAESEAMLAGLMYEPPMTVPPVATVFRTDLAYVPADTGSQPVPPPAELPASVEVAAPEPPPAEVEPPAEGSAPIPPEETPETG